MSAWRRLLWRTFVRTVRGATFLGVLVVGVALAGAFWLKTRILSQLPADLTEFKSYRPPTSCTVLAPDGTEIDTFYLERRIWVPLDELPPHAWEAFVASEDHRFLRHPGVDLVGVVRALYVNFRDGETTQGGSTLTQQLVKNLLVGHQRSYERKLKEAVLAYRIERELSKRDILELYLNYVYLGSGNYGIEAAARDYFGITARAINPGQAAMLAGLVPAPSRYSPRSHPAAAAERRRLALRRMVKAGYLSEAERTLYGDDPVLAPQEARPNVELSTAYATHVRREIRRLLGSELPFRAGLRVHVPIDLAITRVAQDSVREALRALEERQGKRLSIAHLEEEEWPEFLARAPGLERKASSGQLSAPDAGDCFQALAGPPGPGGKNEVQAGPYSFTLVASDGEAKPPEPKPGDVLRVCATDLTHVRRDPSPWAEGAAVVLENATGRVLALVGGYHMGLEGFVRATQARRQPGSSFKPYLYAAALARGHSQLDTVVDAPLTLPAGGGRAWSPKNYTGKFMGALPMRRALAMSLNSVSVRLMLEAGPAEVGRLAQAMGVRTPLRADLTLALGSSEVTPLDQALGYSTIARLGVPAEPVFIDRVEDLHGATLGSAGGTVVVAEQTVARLPGGPLPRALPAGVAYELTDMMREVIRSGTGRAALKEGFDRAGKTGTTNDSIDAWFVGFTPRYTVAVWIGTDGQYSLGDKETGGRAALPAWVKIVDALPQAPEERFPIPDEAVLVPHPEFGWVGLDRGRVPASALALAAIGAAPVPPFSGQRAPPPPLVASTAPTPTPPVAPAATESEPAPPPPESAPPQ